MQAARPTPVSRSQPGAGTYSRYLQQGQSNGELLCQVQRERDSMTSSHVRTRLHGRELLPTEGLFLQPANKTCPTSAPSPERVERIPGMTTGMPCHLQYL